MPTFRITPAHDESVQVKFEIPIKGRQKLLEFSVPRVQFLSKPIADEYAEWFSERSNSEEGLKEHDSILKLLELTTTPQVYEALAKLTVGELNQISAIWGEQSTASLGESSPSSDS
ncbi:hypothetical protein [Rhodococcus triatomae]|nr:hypothetical protein G419_25322 [Rhodococcus triatomae BKS 15-14]